MEKEPVKKAAPSEETEEERKAREEREERYIREHVGPDEWREPNP